MLGKRGRPPFRRTASMTGITFNLGNDVEEGRPPALFVDDGFKALEQGPSSERQAAVVPNGNGYDLQYTAMISPRYYAAWRASGDGYNIQTADFLRSCGLCSRRLTPGRDIYMYRGDTAFCSQECREQQMKQDERKEKCKVKLGNKGENHHNLSEISTANSDAAAASGKNETVAAA
nr:uncharacterized protein LOC109178519 [Ipomoea trifida]